MKKKRFSVEQIVAVLKQAELRMPVADLIRQVGISEQTFYRWKKQYAGMQSEYQNCQPESSYSHVTRHCLFITLQDIKQVGVPLGKFSKRKDRDSPLEQVDCNLH